MNNIDISALEQTISTYPWFSLAHLELFKKACELGEEQKIASLNRTAAYVYSRERLYETSKTIHTGTIVQETVTPEITEKADTPEPVEMPETDEISFVIESDPLHINDLPKIVLAGGDYFDKNDFEEVKLDTAKPLDKFIAEKPSLLRSNTNSQYNENQSAEEIELGEKFDDSGFYTETLARIYTEQCFYKRAIEVYAKLILLYPEKSTYFATLVQELKSKHNQ
ncbi:MAG: hypothetical protein A2X18_02425 [Bacteroidetes bacterium GWF2_40_14]|nr:MAG: hypothetical protein A2X18_02425 [Bacteroidetes bacterium GWF2_40_14]